MRRHARTIENVCWRAHLALCGQSAVFGVDIIYASGAPRSTKMALLVRSGAMTLPPCHALQSVNLRPAATRTTPETAIFPIFV